MSKKAKQLRKLSKEELQKRLDEARLELMKDRGQVAAGTAPKKPGAIRQNRRAVARILTLANE